MAEENRARAYQSSTFALLFSIPEYALELYNSVNGTSYTDPELVRIRKLDAGIELSVRNDVSFFVSSVLNLYEHQSTYNPNMPYRLLQYVAKMYEGLIERRDIYGSRRISLPEPRFAVFYTGERDMPPVEEMKLSDAYETEREGEVQLELRCTVYNLNHPEVRKQFADAGALGGYMHFVDRVKELKGEGALTEEIIDRAINECIAQGILAEFFREHRKEIKNTMIIDETYENRLRLQKLESERELTQATAATVLQNLRNLMETMQLTAEQAMDALMIPQEERQKYKKDIS